MDFQLSCVGKDMLKHSRGERVYVTQLLYRFLRRIHGDTANKIYLILSTVDTAWYIWLVLVVGLLLILILCHFGMKNENDMIKCYDEIVISWRKGKKD